MMAPIFLKVAKKHIETAVFVKVDTNQIYELSGRYGIRSLPTFLFFLDGKKVNQFSGKSFSPMNHSIRALRKHTR
jgi:thiol-disulfide isomerase/thioredoxin